MLCRRPEEDVNYQRVCHEGIGLLTVGPALNHSSMQLFRPQGKQNHIDLRFVMGHKYKKTLADAPIRNRGMISPDFRQIDEPEVEMVQYARNEHLLTHDLYGRYSCEN
ncbi:hypothetical protein PAXRUDRAFT_833192 [Paxillus rubicundulus Ve08.2h10]|uniref:Uncharacterized protein n=1 Tax=Paxillus rubicundulus Ve08.2h10 TaxID=930991 RepID=A0A0D0CE97_9AGAM|nr:hypothetical protein PAXRUDRAFT_833192 [Paxillus rubicundulus Ve08.2h10]